MKRNQIPEFAKSITNLHSIYHTPAAVSRDEIEESSIYLLQHIEINKKIYLIFFDSKCCDFVVRNKTLHQHKLGGIGDVCTNSNGIYSVRIPTYNGSNAILIGASLDKITSTFPMHYLNGQVKTDICYDYKRQGNNPASLPIT